VPPLTIRAANEEDLPAILAIERAAFSDPWTEAAFRKTLGQRPVIATVALDGRAVVGYSVAWIIGDEAELATLAVTESRRRAGIGGRLLDALLDEVDARGGATVYLEVRDSNTAAQALYRSRGFVAAGRRAGYYRRPTEDAIVMRRPGPERGSPGRAEVAGDD